MLTNATWVEVIAAVLGLGGIGFSLWAAGDDIVDLSNVRRDPVAKVGGPRWISALGYLGLNVSLLFAWLGYTTIAMIAAYLPTREDTAWLSLVASYARIEYGAGLMVGQVVQRIVRTKLRNLPRSAWDSFFGEAAEWREKYLAAKQEVSGLHADMRRLEAEVATQRSRVHDADNRAAGAELEVQYTRRWLAGQGLALPPRPKHAEGGE